METFAATLALVVSALCVIDIIWSQSLGKRPGYLAKHVLHRLRVVWRVVSCKNVLVVSHIEERLIQGQPMLQYKTIAHTQYSDQSDATTLNTAATFYVV